MNNGNRIHVRLVPFGKPSQTLELPEGATLEQGLQVAHKTYSPTTVRVGGKSVPAQTPLQDGQIVTTDIPKIVVGDNCSSTPYA